MKLWIDDVRPAPEGYVWCKSVNEAKSCIIDELVKFRCAVEMLKNNAPDSMFEPWILDLDHDAGERAKDGGDYIELLNWLEWLNHDEESFFNFHIHSMNPVGVENMRRIIKKNGWREV